jgi:hypothetical protein
MPYAQVNAMADLAAIVHLTSAGAPLISTIVLISI